jgi:hypothetical protein
MVSSGDRSILVIETADNSATTVDVGPAPVSVGPFITPPPVAAVNEDVV